MAPLLNVLLPTRERCDTLAAALATCTSQDYEHCRFVVADNFSGDATRDVVQAARDPRVVYVNPGRRLSMSENWEFALSHVTEGYVTCLGDDDGLLPGALRRISELLAESGASVVTWAKANYVWPGQQVEAWRNMVAIPLDRRAAFCDSAELLRRVAAFDEPYWMLPMIYTSAVDMKLLADIRAVNGRFFNSRFPDVYSGVAVAAHVPRFYRTWRPLSVNGASSHSNGASDPFDTNAAARRAAQMFAGESNLPLHPSIADAPSALIAVADAFLQAREHLNGRIPAAVDLQVLVRRLAAEAAPYNAERYEAIMGAVREIATKNGLDAPVSANHPAPPEKQVPGIDPRRNQLVLDGAEFGVANVADAARLIHHALVLHERGYDSPLGRLRTFVRLATRKLQRRLGR